MNSHAPHDNAKRGALLKDRMKRQIDGTTGTDRRATKATGALGCKIVLWVAGIGVLCAVLIFSSVLSVKQKKKSQVENLSKRDGEIFIFNYLSSEKSLMGETLFAHQRDRVVQWVYDRLADYNQAHNPKVTKQSSIVEKANAAEEVINNNLALTDGADWDDGVNDRFSSRIETIDKGGGDESDLAHMKLTFLHVLGVPSDAVHAVLFKNDLKEEYRAVTDVTLPDGKERYLDKFNSTRDPQSEHYQEFKEYNPYSVIEDR